MFTEFEKASREWERAVDAEAANLVRAGHEPHDALRIAKGIVARQRQSEAVTRSRVALTPTRGPSDA